MDARQQRCGNQKPERAGGEKRPCFSKQLTYRGGARKAMYTGDEADQRQSNLRTNAFGVKPCSVLPYFGSSSGGLSLMPGQFPSADLT